MRNSLRRLGVSLFALTFALNLPVLAQITGAPPVAPPRPAVAPVLAQTKLANGLTVIALEKPGSGVVTLGVLIKHPDRWLAATNQGLGQLTLDLLDQGSLVPGLRTPEQIAAALDGLGTGLDTFTNTDSSTVQMTVLTPNLLPALQLLKNLVAQPSFSPKEVTKAKEQALGQFQAALDQGNFVAGSAYRRYFLGDTAYQSADIGLPATLQGLTRSQLVTFHQANYCPAQMTLVLTGDLKATQILATVRRLYENYGNNRCGSTPPPTLTKALASTTKSWVVINRPEVAQSTLLYGYQLPSRSQLGTNYPRSYALNALLSGYSARLNQELRIKRGLTYGARSTVDSRRQTSWFTARTATKTSSTLEAFSVMQEVVDGVKTAPPSAEELAIRTTSVLGSRSQGLTTTQGLFSEIGTLVSYDQPLSLLTGFDSKVQAVTPSDIQAFAREYFVQPRGVVVGPAAQFVPALTTQFGPVETIDYDKFVQQLSRP